MHATTPWLSLAIWIPILAGILILAIGRDKSAALVRTMNESSASSTIHC